MIENKVSENEIRKPWLAPEVERIAAGDAEAGPGGSPEGALGTS